MVLNIIVVGVARLLEVFVTLNVFVELVHHPLLSLVVEEVSFEYQFVGMTDQCPIAIVHPQLECTFILGFT